MKKKIKIERTEIGITALAANCKSKITDYTSAFFYTESFIGKFADFFGEILNFFYNFLFYQSYGFSSISSNWKILIIFFDILYPQNSYFLVKFDFSGEIF